jgi:hypothetical protein
MATVSDAVTTEPAPVPIATLSLPVTILSGVSAHRDVAVAGDVLAGGSARRDVVEATDIPAG